MILHADGRAEGTAAELAEFRSQSHNLSLALRRQHAFAAVAREMAARGHDWGIEHSYLGRGFVAYERVIAPVRPEEFNREDYITTRPQADYGDALAALARHVGIAGAEYRVLDEEVNS